MGAGIRYLSVCSGIEAATMAWHPLGWQAAAYSEIEAFPRAVLSHHYPDTPLHGDFTTIGADDYGPVDLLVGGTPCQSFSVAGLRGGLADPRGNLALAFLQLLDRKRPEWVVWENVPGVFSALSHDAPDPSPPNIDLDAGDGPKDGEEIVVEDSYDAIESHAFGCFLAGLSELGYGAAYRVLDAQYAGVPQRRRRVFVVGYLGDWRRAAAVLFERHSMSGDTPPRREKGQNAPTIPSRSSAGGGLGTDFDCDGGLIANPYGGDRVFPTLDTRMDQKFGCNQWVDSGQFVMETAHSLRAEGFDASEDGTGRKTPLVPVCRDVAASLTSNYGKQPDNSDTALGPNLVAFGWQNSPSQGLSDSDSTVPTLDKSKTPAVAFKIRDGCEGGGKGYLGSEETAFTLATTRDQQLHQGSAVRRLTPRECERLQGFPDDYTLVPYRGKPAADGPRYKALGNSMAVPVMRWIGERICQVSSLEQAKAA